MKYVVKNCPLYILGICTYFSKDCSKFTNCLIKDVVDECLEFLDNGRIDYLLNCKNLSDRGRLVKKLLLKFGVEEVS